MKRMVLQAYTPQEDRLFREVLPLPTFRPEISYRDAGLLRTSRNFILPCAHWMCIPSDFVGISQSGLMVLPPILHGRFFDHGLQIPNFSFCPRASINLALFGFKMNEGINLPTSLKAISVPDSAAVRSPHSRTSSTWVRNQLLESYLF